MTSSAGRRVALTPPPRVPPTAAAGPRRRRPSPTAVGAWPLLFVGPLLLGVLVFYYWPIVSNVIVSLQQTNAFGGSPRWVGLANYQEVLASPSLASATLNTAIYTCCLLLGIPLSVVIASLVELPGLAFRGLYRVLFFMPYLAMPMAIAQVWKLVYNGQFGLINQGLRAIGVDNPPYWLVTPGWVILAVSVFGIWSSIGFNVIILSAGLKSIPIDLYEAASLDGAGTVRQFRSITVPLLTPSIFFLTIMTTISGVQLFDGLYALLGKGNPAEPASRSLVYLFYTESFVNNNQGAGAAVAIIILLLVALVTLGQFVVQRKWVNYV